MSRAPVRIVATPPRPKRGPRPAIRPADVTDDVDAVRRAHIERVTRLWAAKTRESLADFA